MLKTKQIIQYCKVMQLMDMSNESKYCLNFLESLDRI